MNTNFLIDEEIEICRAFDATKIQESWSWRSVSMGRRLASELINQKGALDRKALFAVISTLEQQTYSLLPGREYDAPRMRHLLRTLQAFYEDQELVYALKRVHAPAQHPGADALIRTSLMLSKGAQLTDLHAKRAAFAALLTPLRQNVGSCFATAPAIMIQQEQPAQFLADIAQMFGIGGLRRVIRGVEHSVPLCTHSGNGSLLFPFYPFMFGEAPWKVLGKAPGLVAAFKAAGLKQTCEALLKKTELATKEHDPYFLTTPDALIRSVVVDEAKLEAARSAFIALTENVLLKSWEFTVASFAEAKADFSKWNLYASLGVNTDEPHGIGASIHAYQHERLESVNEEIAEAQSRYDHTFAQVKSIEVRMRTAGSEKQLNWLRTDYQMRKHDLNKAIADQDRAHAKGRTLGSLYPFLIRFYTEKFIDYFQEIYDAQMQDMTADLYDDSPAGFRLLYKHGRSNTAAWTLIYTPEEYIDALCAFFIATEGELGQAKEVKGIEQELTHIVTTIITTIRSHHFLESSFERLARTYREPPVKKPLEQLDKIKRKPWAYISGGTMGSLTSCYYGLEEQPETVMRWTEREIELLVFYLDTLKELPLSMQNRFKEDPDRSMLAFSPTHAFLLKPGYETFRKGWDNDAYTYTWVRDHWVVPAQAFLDHNRLDAEMCHHLQDLLLQHLPVGYHPIVKSALHSIPSSMELPEFRKRVIETLGYERWLQPNLRMFAEGLDQVLYSCFPLFHEAELAARLHTLFEQIDEIETDAPLAHLKDVDIQRGTLLTAHDLRLIAQRLVAMHLGGTRSATAFPQKILKSMQKCGFAYPEPILFADTNWVRKRFGFVVGPATEELELWTFDEIGSEGKPLTIWNHYLNGESKEEWGLYTKSTQYML